LPPKSPNLNAHIEWYMRNMKSECLEQMIFLAGTPHAGRSPNWRNTILRNPVTKGFPSSISYFPFVPSVPQFSVPLHQSRVTTQPPPQFRFDILSLCGNSMGE